MTVGVVEGGRVFDLGELRPSIHPSAYLAAGSIVVGGVTIGEGCSIWFNAVLRSDTAPITLGRNVNVQDNCTLHADPGFPVLLEDGVSLGHGAIVHGAHVEEGSLIGMGAVVMNGAHIGRSCLIAGGAVVLPGTVVPPNSLVAGVPAKVRRELDDSERETVGNTAMSYHGRIARFQAELNEVGFSGS
jgi:carbonic anhydrase/acetyltransferase-like protein (isoleucine patch superfamily)